MSRTSTASSDQEAATAAADDVEYAWESYIDEDDNGANTAPDVLEPACTVKNFFSALCVLFCHPCAPTGILRGPTPPEITEYRDVCQAWYSYTEADRTAYRSTCQARVAAKRPTVMRWSHIYPQLSTGDLIFFRCSDTYGSSLVTTFTGQWSHVAMVVVVTSKPNPKTGRRTKRILLAESVSHEDNLEDFTTGESKSGVRLVDLKARLRSSPSHYYGIAHLSHVSEQRKAELTQAFSSFYSNAVNHQYDDDKLQLCRVALDCGALGHNRAEPLPSRYFCSQFVCRAMQDIGLLPEGINAARTCPTDFWSYDCRLRGASSVELLLYMPRLDDPVCGEQDIVAPAPLPSDAAGGSPAGDRATSPPTLVRQPAIGNLRGRAKRFDERARDYGVTAVNGS